MITNDELERMRKETAVFHFKVLSQHCVENLWIGMKNFRHDNRSSERVSNPDLPKTRQEC